MDEQERLEQQLAQIGERYLRRTLDELSGLHELIASLRDHAAAPERGGPLGEIQRLAHRINGSGAMFGFDAISERAREVEVLADTPAGAANLVQRLEACVSSLERQVRADARARGIE